MLTPPQPRPPQGYGCLEYVEWAALHQPDELFREFYEHRAAHLVSLYAEKASKTALYRLKSLIP